MQFLFAAARPQIDPARMNKGWIRLDGIDLPETIDLPGQTGVFNAPISATSVAAAPRRPLRERQSTQNAATA
jgi:hypothetical protein